ncbi:hypothetical protein D3C72_2118350 [compost metagenome]
MKDGRVERRDPAEGSIDGGREHGDRQQVDHQRCDDQAEKPARKPFRIVAIGQHDRRAAGLHAAEDRQRERGQSHDEHQDGGKGGGHGNLWSELTRQERTTGRRPI